MALPEFTVSIWCAPHKAYGFYAEIDASLVDDNVPAGTFQSSRYIKNMNRFPEMEPGEPLREFNVSEKQIENLLALSDQIKYSFQEHPGTPMFGGSFFGLRMARGVQEVTIVWYGKFEDQEANIRALYSSVQAIAEA